MVEYIVSVTSLPVAQIAEKGRIRDVSDDAVAVLVELIREHGFTAPILVRKLKDETFVLVDGAHRLSAARALEMSDIPVRAMRCTNAEARMMEAEANLASGMTPLDDALFLSALQEDYEKRNPNAKRGVAGALSKHGRRATDTLAFADLMANRRGVSARKIQRLTSVGRALSSDQARWLREAGKPLPMSDLLALAKVKDDHARAQACIAFSNGKAKNLRAAVQAQYGAEPKSKPEPSDGGYRALKDAFKRASTPAKRRFVAENMDALTTFLQELGQ